MNTKTLWLKPFSLFKSRRAVAVKRREIMNLSSIETVIRSAVSLWREREIVAWIAHLLACFVILWGDFTFCAWMTLIGHCSMEQKTVTWLFGLPGFSSTHVKTHKLFIQVCKQVVTKFVHKLLAVSLSTSCVGTACSQLLEQVWNKLLTTCNKLDRIIRLVSRLF
jgi:hypothetical protein